MLQLCERMVPEIPGGLLDGPDSNTLLVSSTLLPSQLLIAPQEHHLTLVEIPGEREQVLIYWWLCNDHYG